MAEALSKSEIKQALKQLPGWTLDDNGITKTYQFNHFREAFSFLTRVAFEAEVAGHHPEIYNVYGSVELTLNTHDAGRKVTGKDIALAEAIEGLSWV